MSDEQPLVTVVIATNRLSPFFDEALASCASQTYPEVEVIVIDNGAPDPAAVERAVRTRIPGAQILRIDRASVAIARNIGVDRARGAYVAFLDDDDRWHEERIAAQAAALTDHPEAVASYCGMRVIDESGAVLVQAEHVKVDRLGIARRDTGIIGPNLMARRDALAECGGFPPQNRFAEDLWLVLDLAELGPFVFVDRPLVDYRAHSDNATSHHRELVRSIAQTLRFHMWAARERGDRELVAAFRSSLRGNARYAWWRAARSARNSLRAGRPGLAVGEFVWVLGAAPTGLIDGLTRRAARRLQRTGSRFAAAPVDAVRDR